MKTMIAIVALLLVGCSPHPQHHDKPVLQQPKPETDQTTEPNSTDISQYAYRVKGIIDSSMPLSGLSMGHKCSLRINAAKDGTLISATAIDGDQDLCEIALDRLRGTNLPAMTDHEYSVFHQFILDYHY
jgi:membrane protein involved in colicin uptake